MQFSEESSRVRKVVSEAADAAFRGRVQRALTQAVPVKHTNSEKSLLSVSSSKELAPYELQRLARLLQVRPQWLAIGMGPMERAA